MCQYQVLYVKGHMLLRWWEKTEQVYHFHRLSSYMHPHNFTTHCIPLFLYYFDKNSGTSFSPIVKKKKSVRNPIVHFWNMILLFLRGKKIHMGYFWHKKEVTYNWFPPKKLITINRSFKGHSFYSHFSSKTFFKNIFQIKYELLKKKKGRMPYRFTFPHHRPF